LINLEIKERKMDLKDFIRELPGYGSWALEKALKVEEEILFYKPDGKYWLAFDFPASAFFGGSLIDVFVIDASKLGRNLTFETFYPNYKDNRWKYHVLGILNGLLIVKELYKGEDLEGLLNHIRKNILGNKNNIAILTKWLPPGETDKGEVRSFFTKDEWEKPDAIPWWVIFNRINEVAQKMEVGERKVLDVPEDEFIFCGINNTMVLLAPYGMQLGKVEPTYDFSKLLTKNKDWILEHFSVSDIDTLFLGKWAERLKEELGIKAI
jgi:hypothetical protein